MLGIAAIILTAGTAGLTGWALEKGLYPFSSLAVAFVPTVGLAQRSLYEHVAAVSGALETGDLAAAREAVGRIVGRDVQNLDHAGVAAAALESLAESFNDGVVAPVFWFVLGGLPALFIYKAINTADSLIGHKEPRWRDFGWASARTDDLLNLAPARLAGTMIVAAGRCGWRTMMNDAMKHASPNAGWPEAAMAGALKLKLGGAATYDGIVHDRPVFGDGALATPNDLRRGLRLYVQACALMWLALALGGLVWRL